MEHLKGKALADALMAQRGGREVEEFTWLAEVDPDYMRAYGRIAQMAFGYYEDSDEYPEVLPAKIKELMTVAIVCGQRDADRLPNHLWRALELGATDEEVLETLQVSAACTGGPALRLGVEYLRKFRKQRGEHE